VLDFKQIVLSQFLGDLDDLRLYGKPGSRITGILKDKLITKEMIERQRFKVKGRLKEGYFTSNFSERFSKTLSKSLA
jgi:hypothetical protein